MTEGFDVFVHEVIEAMATSPFVNSKSPRKSVETGTGLPFVFSVMYPGSVCSKVVFAWLSSMRSCGRFGPAIDGTTVDRSSSRYSE